MGLTRAGLFGSRFAFIALAFGLVCAPLILSRSSSVAMATDERLYHVRAVRQIREHWPGLDLRKDSLSAISPGYHYVLAGVSYLTGTGLIPLRLINWTVSLGLLGLVWTLFPVDAGALALAALLPLAFSNFFVKSASWVMTDNPALFLTTATLAVCLPVRAGGTSIWGSAALAGAATFFRQMNIWAAFPVAFQEVRDKSGGRRVLALAASLLPVAVVGVLAWFWRGLVPPAWQGASYQNQLSGTPVCYILSVVFVHGIFYQVAMGSGDERMGLLNRWTIPGAMGGLLIAWLSPTDFNYDAGRWGGYLWEAAVRLPYLHGQSVLFLALSAGGAALLALMTRELAGCAGGHVALLWLGSFVAWVVTFLPNRQIFQRYYEPNILVFLILWLLLVLKHSPARGEFRRWPLLASGAGQLLLTLLTVYPETFGHTRF